MDGAFVEGPFASRRSHNQTKPVRIEEFDAERSCSAIKAAGFAARFDNEDAGKLGIDTNRADHYNLDEKNPHVGEQTSRDFVELLGQHARRLKSTLAHY